MALSEADLKHIQQTFDTINGLAQLRDSPRLAHLREAMDVLTNDLTASLPFGITTQADLDAITDRIDAAGVAELAALAPLTPKSGS